VTAKRASQVLRRRDLILTPDYRRERPPLYRPATVSLQTGTGTVQRTAISTAASTAVIFSLVDRSMASSERDPTSAPRYYAASRGYTVTVITLRPPAPRIYPVDVILTDPAYPEEYLGVHETLARRWSVAPACRLWLPAGPSEAGLGVPPLGARFAPLRGGRP
jgi:hypothetical protein